MTVTAKVKPGTARRLGLRPPVGPALGVIRFPPMPPEKAWAIERAFKESMNNGRWRLEFSSANWWKFTESHRERRKRLGLHWWQRGGS